MCLPRGAELAPDGRIDKSSVNSSMGCHCFVAATVFKAPSGGVIPVELLQEGSVVCGVNGEQVSVARIIAWPKARRAVVELAVDNLRMLVTASHRVVVPSEFGQQEVQAEMLQERQQVWCSSGPQSLTDVRCYDADLEVFEITFNPDIAIESWGPLSDSILTKGSMPCVVPTSGGTVNVRKQISFSQILLLRLTRHPFVFENALAQHPDLHAAQENLTRAGHQCILPSGVKMFVLPRDYTWTMFGIHRRKLGPFYVVVSEQFLSHVEEVLSKMPHKENVRVRSKDTLLYVDPDGVHSESIVVRRTFLDVRRRDHDTTSVSNSTTVAHGGVNPRCTALE